MNTEDMNYLFKKHHNPRPDDFRKNIFYKQVFDTAEQYERNETARKWVELKMTEKNIRATIKNHAKQEQERIIKRMKEACNIKGKENPKQIWYVDEKYIEPIIKQELKNIKRRAKK